MSAPLDDIAGYSAWVYTLAERHPFISHSTLALVPVGATLAKLEGQIECQEGVRVEVWELVDFAARRIRTYSYEVYRHGEKICWYDAWEHPENPALASTFPHHKHVGPNPRDHRVPAVGIRFEAPNLDVVLEDVRREWLRS
jgi:Family of unknown function (DUF6516)